MRCLTAAISAVLFVQSALACPFCGPPPGTINDDIDKSDAAVIAVLVEQPKAAPITLDDEIAPSKFKVLVSLKGKEYQSGDAIEAYYYGVGKKGATYMIFGVDSPETVWGTPLKLTERGVAYMAKLPSLPEEGPKRLAFFQSHLEDPDEMLARDSYDEFAKAPYEDIVALGPHMDREQLLRWIMSDETPSSRRRLYFTLLGVCGEPGDVDQLEELLQSADKSDRSGLDALIACYLKLKGVEGLPLVEEMFIKNRSAAYTEIYSTLMAIRFVGNELEVIPRKRLVETFRLLLDRPALADLVIPDLARWEDWEILPRLVDLFKKADDDTIWIREPIVHYLHACPLPEAKKQIDVLKKVDAKAFERVENASLFGPPVVEKAS